ncbi:transposase [Streptomyces sp. NPDC087851]|uniref:transposase n=1 Tax=Streptomyces sp. NPDC087851 TaxID=3365810 RepID=UPI003814B080
MPADTSVHQDGWDREAFVEEMGLLWEAAGSGRMDGRIIAYLLITDVPYVSSGKLAEALKVSAGSISLATRRLVEAGFVKRHAVAGERSRYFRVDDDVWGSFLAGERRYLDRQYQLAEQAMELLGPEEEAPRRRLRNMRDYMRWVGGDQKGMLTRWREYQRQSRVDDGTDGGTGGGAGGVTREGVAGGVHAPADRRPEEAPEQRRPSMKLSPVLARQLVPDALWTYAEPLLLAESSATGPAAERRERAAFTAVVYVLTSGCGWQQLPAQFGTSSATAHRRFTAWTRVDLWQRWLTAVTGAADALDGSVAAWCAEIVRAAEDRRSAGA